MRLLDEENMDVIVKSCGRKNYEYVFGDNSRWKRTGLIEYYTEGSIKYEKYDEISKEIALEYLFRQNRDLKEIFWYLKEEIVKLSLCERPYLCFEGSKSLWEQGLQNGMLLKLVDKEAVNKDKEADNSTYPVFIRNTRIQTVLSTEGISIKNPLAKPQKNNTNLFLALLPMVGMLLVTVMIRVFIGGSGNCSREYKKLFWTSLSHSYKLYDYS